MSRLPPSSPITTTTTTIRPPLNSLNSSFNSISLSNNNSPIKQMTSLRDTIHKSAGPIGKRPLLSAAASSSNLSTTATTRKIKTSSSPNKSSRFTSSGDGGENGMSIGGGGGSMIRANTSPKKSGLTAGGGLGRMNMVTEDCGPSETRKSPVKKSKVYDRYIPSRSSSTSGGDHTGPILPGNNTTGPIPNEDPNLTADLSQSLGLDPSKRILCFHAEPPPSQYEHSSLLASYARQPTKSSNTTSSATAASVRRHVTTNAEKVLDAPGMVDDYYLNLVDWSPTNLVAIGLGDKVFTWNAESGDVDELCCVATEGAEGSDEIVCSVKFSGDGLYLAVGCSSGPIRVYDVETKSLMRTMLGQLSRVPSLSWSGAVLSSGCRTGEIMNSDVRSREHKVSEMRGHRGEICGLVWRPEDMGGMSGGGQGLLASGGNDNVVNVWDGRMTSVAKMSKTNHTAAVKALAWCPWTPSLLASGGGSSDRTIHFWNTTTSARLNSLVTPSQVTSLVFNPHSKEILSSHGTPDHHLSIWSYPTLLKVTDILNAHDGRILYSALSPDGTVVVTGGADENLKFWRVFERRKGKEKKMEYGGEEENGIQKRGKTGISVR